MRRDKKPYRILVIEDNPGDFVIVEDLLAEQMLFPVITHAINFGEAVNILTASGAFDIILLDLSLPDKSGEQLITEILEISSSCCPVIILTGFTDIDFSIRSVGSGISDYLLKDDLNAPMLYKSIIYSIERKKTSFELERSQKQFSELFNLSPQPMWVFDSETLRFIKINKATLKLYGYSEAEFMEMNLMDIKRVEDIPTSAIEIRNGVTGKEIYKITNWHHKKSGELIEVEIYSTPIIINNTNCSSVIAIDVTEKNQFENKITRAIIKTQEDERYEIGGELHDNVCQILAASQFSLGRLNSSVPKEKLQLLDQCKEHITMALDEIRNLSHRLAPAFFDESNLEQAFKTLFNTFNFNEHAQISLDFDESVKMYPLSRELQLNLYRILQEQLRNILKYAKATTIEVNVLIYNYKLKMQITDNGIGFDKSTAKNGIGLANMRRRTELFSGKFEIHTSPGSGCSIIIDIPLVKM
ncbi:MAG: PAS domain S-box protein [Rhizobacter sp.]|nr:PAS domain S-box protein [Ferruginibacter sp.]